MVRTQIQLTNEQARKLKAIAHERNISMAEAAREAIAQWLETAGTVPQDERRRRAMAAVGKFHSGKNDISEHHDRYLAEALLE
ncbi:MAG: CopG family transcriptional regulator [Nitrososphaerales archaeon]